MAFSSILFGTLLLVDPPVEDVPIKTEEAVTDPSRIFYKVCEDKSLKFSDGKIWRAKLSEFPDFLGYMHYGYDSKMLFRIAWGKGANNVPALVAIGKARGPAKDEPFIQVRCGIAFKNVEHETTVRNLIDLYKSDKEYSPSDMRGNQFSIVKLPKAMGDSGITVVTLKNGWTMIRNQEETISDSAKTIQLERK